VNRLYIAPGTIGDAEPRAYVEAAAAAGYVGIGLRLQKSPHLPIFPIVGNAPLVRDVKHALRDSGLEVLDILSFYLLPGTRLDDFAPALALGAELGARYALTQGDDPDRSRLGDHVAGFCDVAKRYGITPILEFVPNRTLATLPQTLALLDEIGRDDIPVLVDTLHLVRSGGSAADLAKVDATRFPYVQISDGVLAEGEPDLVIAKRIGVGVRRMPGDGVLPLHEIFDALPADIPISVEINMDRPPENSAREWARFALEKTRAFLDERLIGTA